MKNLKLSYKERNWLAGFIDGEGHIAIRMFKKDLRHCSNHIYPTVEVANTHKPVMVYLSKLLKQKLGYMKKYNLNWKNAYRIQISKQNAIEILRLIYPYLKIKKEQAKLCLSLYKTYSKKHARRKSGQFRKLDKRTYKKRAILLNKMSKLNKRGK